MILLGGMAQTNSALPTASSASADYAERPPGSDAHWREVVTLLQRAAELAADREIDSDRFMQAAWTACLDARPGLREQLEDKQLRSQLKKLRKRGRVGAA
jgi:hypothetical protein